MNKIHSAVLCLSWHPDKDNILAFSTREGRIGVLDVNKSANVPTILSSFSSQVVYSIAWSKNPESVNLIACNGQKLVYYSQKDQWKMHTVDHLKHSVSIAVNGLLLAAGTNSGELLFADISKNFYILMKRKISKKYIGMMTWHENKLAIATETGIIFIKHIDSSVSEILDEDLLKLEGHHGRVFAVRFNKMGSHLVSSCMGGFLKVWDIETLTVISSYCINTPVYSAIFLPSNEDIIVCGGQDSTVLTYNWVKHSGESKAQVEVKKKKKKQTINKHILWAAPTEVVKISKNSDKRQKTIVQVVAEDSINELSSDIVKMNLQGRKLATIFNLSSRELTSNPLELIETILAENEREQSFSEMIFGNREEVKSVIATECERTVV